MKLEFHAIKRTRERLRQGTIISKLLPSMHYPTICGIFAFQYLTAEKDKK